MVTDIRERLQWICEDGLRVTTFARRVNRISPRPKGTMVDDAEEGINSWKRTIRQIASGVQEGNIAQLKVLTSAFEQMDAELATNEAFFLGAPDDVIDQGIALEKSLGARPPKPKRRRTPAGRNIPRTKVGAVRMATQDVIIAVKNAVYNVQAGQLPTREERDIALHSGHGRIDSTWPVERVVKELGILISERIEFLTGEYVEMSEEDAA